MNCEVHKKVYANYMLASSPPKQQWICSECGETGIDVIGKVEDGLTYEQSLEYFKDNQVNLVSAAEEFIRQVSGLSKEEFKMRGFTKEESEGYERMLEKMSTKTGRKLYDIGD